MNSRTTPSFWLIVLSIAMSLTGCETHPFSGSAAMRIDVEVYKGPLSEEPEVQWGNLWGLLDQTERGLIETDNLTRAIFANKGFLGLRHEPPGEWPLPRIDNDGKTVRGGTYLTGTTKGDEMCYSVQSESPWYHLRFWRLFGLLDDIDHFDCLELVTLIKDIDLSLDKVLKLKSKYNNLRQPIRGHLDVSVREFLQNIGTLSGDLKFTAFRWSVAAGAGTSLNNLVRIAQVSAIVATSEYANQMNARADALLKQLAPNGLDRRELSPGVALRETEPTDFVHLYEWFNANTGSIAATLAGIGSTAHRVKVTDRLFADHYWAKTNTVYASGRGKVSMAFIKDDVGNWNLKSFDNDPEELLKAYTDFSIETIKKASKIAAEGFAPGAAKGTQSAAELLTLATNTAFGTTTPDLASKGSNLLAPLRQNLLLQLKEKKAQCGKVSNTDETKLKECVTDLQTLITTHNDTIDRIATGMSSPSQAEVK
jgi:hypothetical protein